MNSVIKGVGYVLAHTPDMVIENGTTQTTERIVNPESEYLKELPNHLRSFDEALAYWPNQVYIGNKTPMELAEIEQPWYDKACDETSRYGAYGQMMPEDEFILLMQACDVFDLVKLERGFVSAHKDALAQNPVIDESIMARIVEGVDASEIEQLIADDHAERICFGGELVG